MTGNEPRSGIGLEVLAPGVDKTMPLDGAVVSLRAEIDGAGSQRYKHLTVRWPDGVDVLPDWTLKGLGDFVLATAVADARRLALMPGTFHFDEEAFDAFSADEPTDEQRAVMRDRTLESMAEFDDAYRVVKRKPRISPETLQAALDMYEASGRDIEAVSKLLNRQPRSAYRILARARQELAR
jgi:hypothetical protein